MAAIFGRQLQQVGITQGGRSGRHHKTRIAGQHAAERTLTRAVRPHDGMHLARTYGQVDAFQYFLAFGRGGVQSLDL